MCGERLVVACNQRRQHEGIETRSSPGIEVLDPQPGIVSLRVDAETDIRELVRERPAVSVASVPRKLLIMEPKFHSNRLK
jgi:hypothetical protein